MARKRACKTKRTRGWRERAWKKDPRCHYCRKRIRNVAESTADHVVPVSKRGYSKATNYVLACQPCNFAKGSMDYTDFIKTLKHMPELIDEGDEW